MSAPKAASVLKYGIKFINSMRIRIDRIIRFKWILFERKRSIEIIWEISNFFLKKFSPRIFQVWVGLDGIEWNWMGLNMIELDWFEFYWSKSANCSSRKVFNKTSINKKKSNLIKHRNYLYIFIYFNNEIHSLAHLCIFLFLRMVHILTEYNLIFSRLIPSIQYTFHRCIM